MGELIIWWLTTEQAQKLQEFWNDEKQEYDFPEAVPAYVVKGLKERFGQEGHGEWWISKNLVNIFQGLEWTAENANKIPGYNLRECGGIVMWRHDLQYVNGLGGVYTDRNLSQIIDR